MYLCFYSFPSLCLSYSLLSVLPYSSGSGYSILSELEHHLAMTGNSMRSPGPDTLNEEEEKRRFFAELEQSTSSLNYSELNRQLGNTAPSFLTR